MMPGRASESSMMWYVGAAVAIVAVVGYVVFGWRFGSADGLVPTALGVACAVAAVVWMLRR